MGKAGVASGLAAGAFSAAGRGVGSDGPPAEGEEGATAGWATRIPHVGVSSFASQALFASASGTLAGSSTAGMGAGGGEGHTAGGTSDK